MDARDAITAAVTTASVVANIVGGQGPHNGQALKVSLEQQQRDRILQVEQATIQAGQPYISGGI